MGKTFRLTVNDKTYDVEVGDLSRSPVEVSVDGDKFNVTLEGGVPEVNRGPAHVAAATASAVSPPPVVAPPVKAKGPTVPSAGGDGKVLTAPMPGVVLAVRVKAGDKVKRGEEVCLLESMKMELNILASADGVVKEVFVSQGQNVAHGTVLVEFE